MEAKENRESLKASPILSNNLSMSVGPARQASEKKREFDRRVIALTKEYQELNPESKPYLILEDFIKFYKEAGNNNADRAQIMFQEFDEGLSGQVTKSQYIKKCLQVEDQVVEKINEKVSTINVLKTRYDDAVKKLAETKVL